MPQAAVTVVEGPQGASKARSLMHVFIVGGTGVLGRSLIPLLIAQGHAVRLLARHPDTARTIFGDAVEVAPGDLLASDAASLVAALAGCDAAAHIATAIPRDFSAPGAWEVNTRLRTEGTRRLLDASLAAGVRHYAQESVVLAYPNGGDRWLDEATPLDDSPARADICAPVIAMEAMVRAAPTDRMAWCILRAGRFVGPGTFQGSLIANLRAGKVTVPGDGSNWISPIHVADMATAVALSLASAPGGATFNVVAEPIREGDYDDRLAALLGVAPPPRDPARLLPPSYRCASDAARRQLGWTPTHSIWPAGLGPMIRDPSQRR